MLSWLDSVKIGLGIALGTLMNNLLHFIAGKV